MPMSQPMPLPMGGVDLSEPFERQPVGTTPHCLNVRTRDWRVGGRQRLCQRSGLVPWDVDAVPGGGAIRSLTSFVSSRIVVNPVQIHFQDDFTVDADTNPGELTDLDGDTDPTNDWRIHEATQSLIAGTVDSGAKFPLSATLAPGSSADFSEFPSSVRINGETGEVFASSSNARHPNASGTPTQYGSVYVYDDSRQLTQELTHPVLDPSDAEFADRSVYNGASFGVGVASCTTIETGVTYHHIIVATRRARRASPTSSSFYPGLFFYRRADNETTYQLVQERIFTNLGTNVTAFGLHKQIAAHGPWMAVSHTSAPAITHVLRWTGTVGGWTVVSTPGFVDQAFGLSLDVWVSNPTASAFSSNGFIVIGAPNATSNAGIVRVYRINAGSFTGSALQTINGAAGNHRMGYAVAVCARWLAVISNRPAGTITTYAFNSLSAGFTTTTPPTIAGIANQEYLAIGYDQAREQSYLMDTDVANTRARVHIREDAAGSWATAIDLDEATSNQAAAVIPEVSNNGMVIVGDRGSAKSVFVYDLLAGEGVGPFIDASINAVVDDFALIDSAGFATYACLLLYDIYTNPAFPAPFIMEIRAKTAANNLSSRTGVIGLFCYADQSKLNSAPATDRSSIFTVGRTTTGSETLQRFASVNNIGSPAVASFEPGYELKPNTEYTLRVSVNLSEVEVWIIEQNQPPVLLSTIQNARRVGSTDYTPGSGDTRIGFILGGVNGGSNALWQWVDDFTVWSAETVDADQTTTVIAVSGTSAFFSKGNGWSLVPNSAGAITQTPTLCGVIANGSLSDNDFYLYLLSGREYGRINLRTMTYEPWTSTTGTMPQGVDTLLKARFAVNWRNRMVMFGVPDRPQEWWMTRQDDPRDLNVLSDAVGHAVSASDTVTETGLMPEPLTAVVPFTANMAIFGTANQTLMLVNDPLQGGYFTVISQGTGIVGPFAWALDRRGHAYFVSRQGLNVIREGTMAVIPLTEGRFDAFFDSIDWENTITRLEWVPEQRGLRVIFQPTDATKPGKHFWYEPSTNAILPDTYPLEIEPSAVGLRAGVVGNVGSLLGHRDGRVRRLDPHARFDDAHEISSEVVIGPIGGGGHDRVSISGIRIRLAEGEDECRYELRSSDSSEAVLETEPLIEDTMQGGGWQHPVGQRISGGSVAITIRSAGPGTTWAIEAAEMDGGPGGPIRRRG